MSDVVDRIATEVFDKFASDDGSPCCLYSDDICRKIVRAVIAALREPTNDMVDVLRNELPLVDDPAHVSRAEFVKYWQSAIDVAMKTE